MKRAPRTVETAATKRIHWMPCCASQEKAAASSPVVLYVTALARCASVIPTSLAHTLTASATAAVALGTVALSPRPSSRPSRVSYSRARRGRTGGLNQPVEGAGVVSAGPMATKLADAASRSSIAAAIILIFAHFEIAARDLVQTRTKRLRSILKPYNSAGHLPTSYRI